jgi:dienelactone hydrolase
MDSTYNLIKRLILTLLVGVCLTACQTTPPPTAITSTSFTELKTTLSGKIPALKTYWEIGPFSYVVKNDFKVRISEKEIINSDLYLSDHKDPGPLVIIQHGNLSNKKFHENQARHLASWGIHVLVLEQPNRNRWIKNGIVISQLVKLLEVWPQLLGRKFDVTQIIGVGHSFGGSAMAIAAGKGAPFKGVILLDPAIFNKTVPKYIEKIKLPVILLGADKEVFVSRQRELFFQLKNKNIAEISVTDATHNDAQFPDQFSLRNALGIGHTTSEARQQVFTAAIVASVFSFVLQDGYDYAWSIFKRNLQSGLFKDAIKK